MKGNTHEQGTSKARLAKVAKHLGSHCCASPDSSRAGYYRSFPFSAGRPVRRSIAEKRSSSAGMMNRRPYLFTALTRPCLTRKYKRARLMFIFLAAWLTEIMPRSLILKGDNRQVFSQGWRLGFGQENS